MIAPSSPTLWSDRTPLLVLGTGGALPGEPISTEALLLTMERRFGLSLYRRGMTIARKLGIHTRYLCRDMAIRMEAPRKGHRNPELAAAALQRALVEAELRAQGLAYLIGHTATAARLMPPDIGSDSEMLDYCRHFVEDLLACSLF